MNRHLPRIRVVTEGRCSMAAVLSFLFLHLALGAEVSSHLIRGIPQTAAGSSPNSAADSSGDAEVSGTVRDRSGTALGGARVTLTDERNWAQRVVLTTENGAYVFTPVEPGFYALAAELSGFEKAVRQHLTVTDHQHLNVELTLAAKPPGSDRQTGVAHTASQAKGTGSGQIFDYDAKPDYRPGDIGSSSGSGGYSSGANADSYDLILAYVESERPGERNEREGTEKDTNRGGATESRSLEKRQPSEVDEGTLQAWNENQFFSRGSDLLLHREFTPASELFQHGVARFPGSAKLQMGLGVALYARGLYDQAVRALLQATDMLPSDPRPYLLLARAYTVSHSRSDEVVKRLARLVALEPSSALAHYYYALALGRSSGGKPGVKAGQIEHLLDDAVTLDPQFADAHLELGALFAEQAKYAEAIREYRRAIVINPDLAAAHYRLAQAYARTGDPAAAQTELGLYEHLRKASSKKY
jgi:tetratricopeptide (TPR) repeat protein